MCKNISISIFQSNLTHDLHIFNTSLAVLLIDLSSEVTNYSAIFANTFVLSGLSFKFSKINCFKDKFLHVIAQYSDFIKLLEIIGLSSLKVGKKYYN